MISFSTYNSTHGDIERIVKTKQLLNRWQAPSFYNKDGACIVYSVPTRHMVMSYSCLSRSSTDLNEQLNGVSTSSPVMEEEFTIPFP